MKTHKQTSKKYLPSIVRCWRSCKIRKTTANKTQVCGRKFQLNSYNELQIKFRRLPETSLPVASLHRCTSSTPDTLQCATSIVVELALVNFNLLFLARTKLILFIVERLLKKKSHKIACTMHIEQPLKLHYRMAGKIVIFMTG